MCDNEKQDDLEEKIIFDVVRTGIGFIRFDENGLYFLDNKDVLFKQTEKKA